MYLQNKYSNWYFNIIKQARTRLLNGYAEKHHIIPKSLGGNNTKDNLVALTAREHFVCHLLLTRMTTGEARKKMVFAVFYLTGKGKSNRDNRVKNSRLYSKLKQDLCEIVSLQHKGRKRPERSVEYKLKQTKSKLGQKIVILKDFISLPGVSLNHQGKRLKIVPQKLQQIILLDYVGKITTFLYLILVYVEVKGIWIVVF